MEMCYYIIILKIKNIYNLYKHIVICTTFLFRLYINKQKYLLILGYGQRCGKRKTLLSTAKGMQKVYILFIVSCMNGQEDRKQSKIHRTIHPVSDFRYLLYSMVCQLLLHSSLVKQYTLYKFSMGLGYKTVLQTKKKKKSSAAAFVVSLPVGRHENNKTKHKKFHFLRALTVCSDFLVRRYTIFFLFYLYIYILFVVCTSFEF